jgi:hypothetical protein
MLLLLLLCTSPCWLLMCAAVHCMYNSYTTTKSF